MACKKEVRSIPSYKYSEIIEGCNEGVCLACGEVGQPAEPDAKDYVCDRCGCRAVWGLELAVIAGWAYFEGEDDE